MFYIHFKKEKKGGEKYADNTQRIYVWTWINEEVFEKTQKALNQKGLHLTFGGWCFSGEMDH